MDILEFVEYLEQLGHNPMIRVCKQCRKTTTVGPPRTSGRTTYNCTQENCPSMEIRKAYLKYKIVRVLGITLRLTRAHVVE